MRPLTRVGWRTDIGADGAQIRPQDRSRGRWFDSEIHLKITGVTFAVTLEIRITPTAKNQPLSAVFDSVPDINQVDLVRNDSGGSI